MPGRPEFSQPGTQGGGQTVATTDRPEITNLQLTQDDDVSAGVTERVEAYAPEGSIYRVTGLRMRTTGIEEATTGNHRFQLRPLDAFPVIQGAQNPDQALDFNRSHWANVNVQEPDTDEATLTAIQNLRATDSAPIVIRYTNDTDATQDESRTVFLVTEEASL